MLRSLLVDALHHPNFCGMTSCWAPLVLTRVGWFRPGILEMDVRSSSEEAVFNFVHRRLEVSENEENTSSYSRCPAHIAQLSCIGDPDTSAHKTGGIPL